MRIPYLAIGVAVALTLVATAPPASSDHESRTDNRLVAPSGLPVVFHIPVVAGYEPVPTPQHCLNGKSLSSTVYSQGFEGAHGYTFTSTPLSPSATNLWSVTTFKGPGIGDNHNGNRLYFGRVSTGFYDGFHQAGSAVSPSIVLPSATGSVLKFSTKWHVEWLKGYDHLWVEAKNMADGKVHLLCTGNAYDRGDGSSSGDLHRVGSCSPIHFAPCPYGAPLLNNAFGIAQWEDRMIEIPSYLLGKTVQLQFTFDSADGVANDFLGWMVDDVQIGSL